MATRAAEAQTPGQPDADSGHVVVTVTLESLRLPMVSVDLLPVGSSMAIARTTSDNVGQVAFPGVPVGQYVVHAVRDGFVDADSPPFEVRAGGTAQVLLEMRLTFVRESVNVVATSNSPTESVQPVAVSDALTGTKMDVQPLAGDDFQSLMTLLPSVIRGPEGRLRVKGGTPTTGAIQLSSASLNDPSTGDFDLELPSGAVESVEILSNPFAAEYGRFSTSVTQVTTRRGSNDWTVKAENLMPGFGRGLINKLEPRLSFAGPLKRDRLQIGQYMQYRYLRTPVRSLPGQPDLGVDSFDSFTRLDANLSARHTMVGTVVYFPRKITNPTLMTFRASEATPNFTQEGFAGGLVDRVILADWMVLESTVAARRFEVDMTSKGTRPMVYAPQGQSGHYFNREERHVHSVQVVEALTVSKDMAGQHVFKFGVDLQRSGYDGDNFNQDVEVRRLDGTLAERSTYAPSLTHPKVTGLELSLFAQDRWRLTDRVMFELGFRIDRDDVVEQVNYSPRAGVALSLLPEGRGILRGGIGKFAQRTPLNLGAFGQLPVATVTRYAADGRPLGAPVTLRHVIGPLETPESLVGTIAWDQRFGRRLFFKAAYLIRDGSHDAIVDPDRARGTLTLDSRGESKYWEWEVTGRYLGAENRDLTVSYVRTRSTRDLNDYDAHFGNFKDPIIRPNEHWLSPTDVPNRLIIRGSQALVGRWVLAPVFEWRTGFPFTAVDEFQDFVGARNRTGRLPTVATLDFSLVRPWRFRRFHFNAGLKVYNAFGSGAERDMQVNVTAPDYGRAYNPVPRSIGLTFSSRRP